MASSALEECVKIEVSTRCLQAAWETETLKSVICDSEREGKGCTLGKMQTQMMGTTGECLMPAAMLKSAARVLKSSGFGEYV